MIDELWVSNRDQTLSGVKVTKGQIIRPTPAPNAHIIFSDKSQWAFRYRGGEPLLCDTDGCMAQFDCTANLYRHREIIHKPERDSREIARLAMLQDSKEAELTGETIGGHEITQTKRGPRGPVPYVGGLSV